MTTCPAHLPELRVLTFVDNWEACARDPSQVLQAAAAQESFVQSWDLQLDPAKTKFWATQPRDRAFFRAAGSHVALDFKELGAHFQVSRRQTNSTQVARFKDLKPKWRRLAASVAPYTQKLRCLRVVAWPAALHAISIVSVGSQHVVSLRAGAMEGIGAKAPGANGRIHMGLVEHPSVDPGFYALVSSFRDARVLSSQRELEPLLDQVVESAARHPGPAKVLLERANGVGVSWDPGMHSFVDDFGPLRLWTCSPQELEFRLVWAWQNAIKCDVSHRPGFHGLVSADPFLTRRVLLSPSCCPSSLGEALVKWHLLYKRCPSSSWRRRKSGLQILWWT